MFWRFGGYANISSLDAVLEKPHVTVDELLEESDLIQELKSQNSKLIEYLREDKVLERLLKYVVSAQGSEEEEPVASPAEQGEQEESSPGNPLNNLFSSGKRRSRSKSLRSQDADEESKDEKKRLKYAYLSCEVLSSDVWSITEALLENPEALRKLWDYLRQECPLDNLQASYFTKVNESLLEKKTEAFLDFFKTMDDVVPHIVRHVDCPVIMDLLLKMISMERSEGGAGIIDVSLRSVVVDGCRTLRVEC